MVKFLGVRQLIELLQTIGVEQFLSDLIRYTRDDYLRWQKFEKSPRVASHSPDGVIELMPTSDGELYTFKYVNGHPVNTQSRKLTVTAFGVLADVRTGYPLLLSEMTICTALRTAATSALAAGCLARRGSNVMALIGLGAQAEFQALAFKAEIGIRKLQVFDVDPAALAKFGVNMRGQGLEITSAPSVAEAVKGADIITTATAAKRNAVILTNDMIGPGVHINAIGGDCPGKTELDRALLERSRIIVEYLPQSRIEGEIQQLSVDSGITELWEVLAGKRAGRVSAADVTIFDSVGFAIEDFSLLRYLNDLTNTLHVHHEIDLVPSPEDPKDLFGLLRTKPSVPLRASKAS
jgi:ornithine cyclodeaminase